MIIKLKENNKPKTIFIESSSITQSITNLVTSDSLKSVQISWKVDIELGFKAISN